MVTGAVTGWSRDWRVSLAGVILLAGFVPGLLLYRREHYPSMHVMMYALAALVVFAASGLARLRAHGLRLLAGFTVAEYAFVWLFRAHLPWAPPPGVPYRDSPLYVAAVVLVLGGALAAVTVLTRRLPLGNSGETSLPDASGSTRQFSLTDVRSSAIVPPPVAGAGQPMDAGDACRSLGVDQREKTISTS